MDNWELRMPFTLRKKYEFHNFNHAYEILTQAYKEEYHEIIEVLEQFEIRKEDILQKGGNESPIPKKFSEQLRPRGWEEVKITGDLHVKLLNRKSDIIKEIEIEKYIDGHNIDYVKNKVALDLEWNSKDQTFDRDLYAFRSFYECNAIACGIIITRSHALNSVFDKLDVKSKYGASTTWMGKLLPRIQSGRNGGCPLLVIGILPDAVIDLEDENE